jgi:hypothetical protein
VESEWSRSGGRASHLGTRGRKGRKGRPRHRSSQSRGVDRVRRTGGGLEMHIGVRPYRAPPHRCHAARARTHCLSFPCPLPRRRPWPPPPPPIAPANSSSGVPPAPRPHLPPGSVLRLTRRFLPTIDGRPSLGRCLAFPAASTPTRPSFHVLVALIKARVRHGSRECRA